MTLVLFDFDGTLTTKDTLWQFIQFFHSAVKVRTGYLWLFPLLTMHVIGLRNAEDTKRSVLKYFFSGRKKSEMEEAGARFCRERLPKIMNEDIYAQLRKCVNEGNEVCIVTASCDIWVKPFAEVIGCALISTHLEFSNQIFIGRFETPNCNREEKVRRVRQNYTLEKYSKIIVYGNRGGDDALFAIAHETHIVNHR